MKIKMLKLNGYLQINQAIREMIKQVKLMLVLSLRRGSRKSVLPQKVKLGLHLDYGFRTLGKRAKS